MYTDKCVYTHTHTYPNGILLGHKKNEILPSATTWMDLEGIILIKISQTEKANTECYHLFVESKK